MFSDNYTSTCGFSAFPALFQKARGINSLWRLHQESANMDQLVLQSSYRVVQPGALSSLHQRGFSTGCPADSNWQLMPQLRQASSMSLEAFEASMLKCPQMLANKKCKFSSASAVYCLHSALFNMLTDTFIVVPKLPSIKNKWSMLISLLQKRLSGGWQQQALHVKEKTHLVINGDGKVSFVWYWFSKSCSYSTLIFSSYQLFTLVIN